MYSPTVQGLNGFGLEVPDLAVAKQFYETFGLESGERGAALTLRSKGRANDEIVIVQGATKRMHHLSFRINPGDEHAFADKLKAAGLDVNAGPAGATRDGLWFQDPWGTWINLTPMPPQAATVKTWSTEPRVDVHRWRELERDPKPARIGPLQYGRPSLCV